jgi:5'-3' exonuclease
MVELEADDAMASAARLAVDDARVRRVYLCTPDKDMAQCVVGDRVVQLDRRSGTVRDAQGVVAKFGVEPDSIPDYLALTGDSADGFPGLPGWGPKSAGAVLGRYRHLEAIPAEWVSWETPVRGAARLAATLVERWEEAILFRRLATLKTDAHLFGSIEELRWAGPRPEFAALCADLGALDLAAGASELSAAAERDRSHPRGGAPRI